MKKNALEHAEELARELERGRPVLLLDFDGTLAPIVPLPGKARMNARMRATLAACAKRFPTAVISGRALKDVRARVGLSGIAYSGNHGHEMRVRGARTAVAVPALMQNALRAAKHSFAALSAQYPALFLEDKTYSLSLHYRQVPEAAVAPLTRAVRRIVREAGGAKILRLIPGIKVFNVLPAMHANKGTAVRALLRELGGTRRSAIFIGDDDTDEDAFKALPRGVTIHVGNGSTAAKYYLPAQKDVEPFLRTLAHSRAKR